MNLIGKIFIVIIVVMSVLFMGLSMAVYSAHRNWPAEVKKVQDELTAKEAELEREKNRYQRLESQLQPSATWPRIKSANWEPSANCLSSVTTS